MRFVERNDSEGEKGNRKRIKTEGGKGAGWGMGGCEAGEVERNELWNPHPVFI